MDQMNPQQPHQVRNQQAPNDGGNQQPPPNNPSHNQGNQPGGNNWFQPTLGSKIVVTLVIVAGLSILGVLIAGIFLEASSNEHENMVKHDQYQAVFLTNDQVYFGNITKAGNGMMVLENVYYLQVDQQIQPNQRNAQNNQQQQPDVSLAELGDELHAPEDKMFISSDKVVLWENLKPDGQVAQAIKENEQNQQDNDGSNGSAGQGQTSTQNQPSTQNQQGTSDTDNQSTQQQTSTDSEQDSTTNQ
ncbi:hypothetical protein BRC19_01900 [Candidatus Saccharibacteria bacterium QS_5_54_17]|nr:MAG: hypothetical protein BRC19_01900 [Candidatus Saccharibacteria bacterium QS_5_54_17]